MKHGIHSCNRTLLYYINASTADLVNTNGWISKTLCWINSAKGKNCNDSISMVIELDWMGVLFTDWRGHKVTNFPCEGEILVSGCI